MFRLVETRRSVGDPFSASLSKASQKGQSFLDSNTEGKPTVPAAVNDFNVLGVEAHYM